MDSDRAHRPHTAPATVSQNTHAQDTHPQDTQYCTVQTDFGEIEWPVANADLERASCIYDSALCRYVGEGQGTR
jgi:hypothetical protein